MSEPSGKNRWPISLIFTTRLTATALVWTWRVFSLYVVLTGHC